MIFSKICKPFSLTGREISLTELLDAREQRAALQAELLAAHRQTLLSATLTAVGAVKKNGLFDYAFAKMLENLAACFADLGVQPLEQHIRPLETGHEALFVLPIEARQLKQAMIALEDRSPLARLWDLDVFEPQGRLLSRADLGFSPRPCLLCEQTAKICARQRSHSLEAIFAEMQQRAVADWIGEQAYQALLDEAYLTPKAGLVDRQNSGSHKDMDLHTFERSAKALRPFFSQFVLAGMHTANLPDGQILPKIRPLGLRAEQAMFTATQGVNTHKGAIFAFGVVCAAVGRLFCTPPASPPPLASEGREVELAQILSDKSSALSLTNEGKEIWLDQVLHQAAQICSGVVAELQNYPENAPLTAGVKLFRQYGLTGARGEAQAGFPLVRQVLPTLFEFDGDLEHRQLVALLQLMAINQDTNVVNRGGLAGLDWLQNEAKRLLDFAHRHNKCSDKSQLVAKMAEFDTACIAKNLSAGGSADLLALTIFFFYLLR